MCAASNTSGQRKVPYARIVHQPSAIYRMRYKAEKRNTFLYAENYNATNMSPTNSAMAESAAGNPAGGKKSASSRKKITASILNSETASAANTSTNNNDGMFPKIEVITP